MKFILLATFRCRDFAAMVREPVCIALNAAFKDSCWCASRVILESNMRKLWNGSSPEALAPGVTGSGAVIKVVDKTVAASHATRPFGSIIDASL